MNSATNLRISRKRATEIVNAPNRGKGGLLAGDTLAEVVRLYEGPDHTGPYHEAADYELNERGVTFWEALAACAKLKLL